MPAALPAGRSPHLFVDISSHGFGHLAITAPLLRALAERLPGLRLSVRSALPETLLRERIPLAFRLIAESSDFGYRMLDATRVDLPASAADYRRAHADWPGRVAAEARFLQNLAPDLVLSNVGYLPLAGAARLGLPAFALCSLNWADLFAHFFADRAWAPAIHAEMLAAYRSATAFLRVTPAMPMAGLDNRQAVGPIAALGRRRDLGLGEGRAVLVAMGGIAHRLPVEGWPRHPGLRWLVPAAWACRHPDAVAFESLGLSFTDLLSSVDAVVTKPGYGTFTEAACNGTPVLYQQRADWPEQACLIDWLRAHGRCAEIDEAALHAGRFDEALAELWRQPGKTPPAADGAEQAAAKIMAALAARSGC